MGEVFERKGRRAEVLVARDELVLLLFDMDAHIDGAGPHFHKRHVDSFFVIDGELQVMTDGEPRTVRAGEIVAAPPGTVHAFGNVSDGHVRFLNLHTPGVRFDEYMRKMNAHEDLEPEAYDVFELAPD